MAGGVTTGAKARRKCAFCRDTVTGSRGCQSSEIPSVPLLLFPRMTNDNWCHSLAKLQAIKAVQVQVMAAPKLETICGGSRGRLDAGIQKVVTGLVVVLRWW